MPEKHPLNLEVQHEWGVGSQVPSFTGSQALRYESIPLSLHAAAVSQAVLRNQRQWGPSADWLTGLCKHMCLG